MQKLINVAPFRELIAKEIAHAKNANVTWKKFSQFAEKTTKLTRMPVLQDAKE